MLRKHQKVISDGTALHCIKAMELYRVGKFNFDKSERKRAVPMFIKGQNKLDMNQLTGINMKKERITNEHKEKCVKLFTTL